MKRTKQILSVLLALITIISIIPMSSITASAAESWLWPVAGYTNWTTYENHRGIDIPAPSGTPIRAAKSGTLYVYNNTCNGSHYGASPSCTISGCNSTTGKCVYIIHGDGTASCYMHLVSLAITSTKTVKQGDIIGYVGTTGPSTGNHLHFEAANGSGTNYWSYSLMNPGKLSYIYNSSIATTGITLNSSPFTLKVGESKTLSATVSPSNATNKTVTWSSSNTSVATVSSSGVVKAVGTGACAITVKASGGQTASVVVIVRNESPAPVANATYNGHYYELYQDVLSWTDAKEYCESKGGHLVTITSQEENNFVQTLASSGEKEYVYIGATDETTEGTWKWVTDETFSYTNFGDGEPSETEYDVEDYVRLSSSTGKWHDVRDVAWSVGSCGFICEYETPFEPDAVTVIGEKVYELYDREYPITLAENYANDNNGDLLTINSEEEQNAVASWIQANSSTKYVALGAYADSNRVWHWSNGDKWSYDNWRSGEPNNTNNLEDGATIVISDYGWNDVPRTNAYVFVVEYSLEDWEKDNNEPDNPNTPDTPNIPDTEYIFSIQEPSRNTIRNKDGIKLHANVEGDAPAGSYVEWSWNNSKFDVEKNNDGTLTIISENNGKTTFTATLYSEDGKVLATDSIEMTSKAGFFDKIGGFFRSLFGATKIYEN